MRTCNQEVWRGCECADDALGAAMAAAGLYPFKLRLLCANRLGAGWVNAQQIQVIESRLLRLTLRQIGTRRRAEWARPGAAGAVDSDVK